MGLLSVAVPKVNNYASNGSIVGQMLFCFIELSGSNIHLRCRQLIEKHLGLICLSISKCQTKSSQRHFMRQELSSVTSDKMIVAT